MVTVNAYVVKVLLCSRFLCSYIWCVCAAVEYGWCDLLFLPSCAFLSSSFWLVILHSIRNKNFQCHGMIILLGYMYACSTTSVPLRQSPQTSKCIHHRGGSYLMIFLQKSCTTDKNSKFHSFLSNNILLLCELPYC